MTNDQIFNLKEGVKDAEAALQSYVSPESAKEAQDIWRERVKTTEGQLEVLNAAKGGDLTATNYLFTRYFKLITKAFWYYYVGPNKKLGYEKIANDEALRFASIAYNMLAGKETPSPYNTFNPDKFDHSRTDLVNQFSWYFYRYLQSEAFKLIRDERRGGFGGNIDNDNPEGDITVASYDEYYQNSDEAATDDFSDTANLNAIFDQFSQWLLDNKGELYQGVWDHVRAGMPMERIAGLLGMKDDQQVRNYFDRIRKYFKKLYPELGNR